MFKTYCLLERDLGSQHMSWNLVYSRFGRGMFSQWSFAAKLSHLSRNPCPNHRKMHYKGFYHLSSLTLLDVPAFNAYQRSVSPNPSFLLQSLVVHCWRSVVEIQMTKTGERLLTSKNRNWMSDIIRCVTSSKLGVHLFQFVFHFNRFQFSIISLYLSITNGKPIIAIFETRVAHVILKLMWWYLLNEAQLRFSWINYFYFILIFVQNYFSYSLDLNSNQICFLFLEYCDREGVLAFGIHSE